MCAGMKFSSPTSAAASAYPTIPPCRAAEPRGLWRDGSPDRRGWDARLVFEPGRLIVGNAGCCWPRDPREAGRHRPFVIVDAAMNDLMRPAFTTPGTASKRSARRAADASPTSSARCARPATPSRPRARWTEVAADDLVVFRTAGAYAAAMSSTYNSAPADARGAGRRQPLGRGPAAGRDRGTNRRRPCARLARRLRGCRQQLRPAGQWRGS